jgi:fatty acid synthase subunit alpha
MDGISRWAQIGLVAGTHLLAHYCAGHVVCRQSHSSAFSTSGQRVTITFSDSSPSSLPVYGAAQGRGTYDPRFRAVLIKYDVTSQLIDLTICEECQNVAVPLCLQFQYKPAMGFSAIHEVIEDRNTRIKEFYRKLWFGDESILPSLDVRDTFTGPEVTIDVASVEEFCGVVGNEGESFKSVRTTDVKALMDYAIVTGWQVSPRF